MEMKKSSKIIFNIGLSDSIPDQFSDIKTNKKKHGSICAKGSAYPRNG